MNATPPLQPDYAASWAFLQRFHPGRLIVVTGISLDKKSIPTATFGPDDRAKFLEWVAACAMMPANLYFSVGEPLKAATKKLDRADIARVWYLHVDIDPRAGEDLGAEQTRILNLLRNPPGGFAPPTAIVYSGGGYQGYWALTEPLSVNGDVATAEDLKLYNLQLERVFGGDNCHDVSRIMRIPGTINVPDAKKAAKGRPAALAQVVEWNADRVYPIGQFTKAAPGDVAPPSAIVGAKSKPGKIMVDRANVRPVTADELRALGLAEEWIDKAGRVYADPKIKDAYPSRSEHQMAVTCAMVRAKLPPEVIYSVITDKAWGVSESVREKGHAYAERQVQRSAEKVAKEDRPGGKNGPAGRELARMVQGSYGAPLIFHQDEWYEYRDGLYLPVEVTAIRKAVYETAESAEADINSKMVSDTVDGLETLCLIRRDRLSPPCWMDDRAGPKAEEIVAFANGLLHLPTKTLYPHEPAFITFNALPYGYDPAAQCPRWMQYLGELWPTEQDCIDVLQEFLGYLLTGDTSLQKILCIIGAKRSGKGTLARVTRKLIGEQNVASPKLQSFGENFGRQCLINKRLAILADVRIGPRTDVSSAATTLLEISGEDPQEIPRKNKLDWSGHSEVRFILISNLPPSITDPSGVLPTRYLMLPMRQSFFGKEDIDLTAKLVAELPGILNWAIEGRERLYRNGRFTTLTSGSDLVEQTHRASSGIQAFIDDACEIGADFFVSKDGLYFAYLAWFDQQGMHDHNKLSKEMFGMNFTGATMGLGVRGDNQTKKGLDKRNPERRVPVWRGVRRQDGFDLPDYSASTKGVL